MLGSSRLEISGKEEERDAERMIYRKSRNNDCYYIKMDVKFR